MFGIRSKTNEPDPRVAQALDQLEIKYEVEDDGDYKIGFALEDRRSQIGYIRSRTMNFGEFELRRSSRLVSARSEHSTRAPATFCSNRTRRPRLVHGSLSVMIATSTSQSSAQRWRQIWMERPCWP